MLCLEIGINGQRYCLAGVGQAGILSAFVTYYRLPADQTLPDLGRKVHLNVSGSRPDGSSVQWAPGSSPDATVPLRVGDVVTIRVVEAATADPGRAPP